MQCAISAASHPLAITFLQCVLKMVNISVDHRRESFQANISTPDAINIFSAYKTSGNERFSPCISLCVGCGEKIVDRYLLRVAPDMEWHTSCLKCDHCGVELGEKTSCYIKHGKAYCALDYIRLFAIKCTRCTGNFQRSDSVMRARNQIYHVECFACAICGKQLLPGDEFALREEGLCCLEDNENIERDLETDGTVEEIQSPDDGTSVCSPNPEGKRKSSKSGRVRTVLNEKQLSTLRAYYHANPRPDAPMREQLVEMTSLSHRVIRVWFQNKRCKDKKRQKALKDNSDVECELSSNANDDDKADNEFSGENDQSVFNIIANDQSYKADCSPPKA